MRLDHDSQALRTVTDPREFGKVAVLFGGTSSEREISLLTGRAVHAALQRSGIDAYAVDPREKALQELVDEGFDRAWVALHGPGGEDGTGRNREGIITRAGVCMDKLRTKQLVSSVGIATADFVVLRDERDFDLALTRLGLPMFVKPATQGSSVGMSKVERPEDLPVAFAAAAATDPCVLAEAYISGAEYTVGVLAGEALPSIRIRTTQTFYDYQAKYFRDDTQYDCPSGLSAETERHLAALALGAFDATGASGWGRADFMMDSTGRPLLLEINTVPGMTDHSLVPMAARARGMSFEQLVWRVLETSFTRRRRSS